MAISFANVIKATGNGVTSVTTSGVTTTTGSTFVIACSFGSSPYWSTPSSFTDNKGNTYTRTGVQAASGCSIELAHCINGTGGAGHTATVSGSTGDYPVVYFLELTGVAASGYDSGAHVKTTDTSSPYTVTSNALAQADSAILVLSTSFEGGTVNQTISSGYTVVKEDDYSNFFGSAFGYKTVSSASAETATVGGVAADTAMGIYAFKAAAAGSEDFEANQTAAVTTQAATVTNDTPLWTPTQLTNEMVWYVADNSANTITGGFLTTLADKGGTNKPASVKNGTTNLRAEIDNTLNGRVVWESKSGGSNLGHLRSGATGITRNTGQVTIFSLVRPSSSGIVALTDVGDGYFARASLYMSSGTELHCSGRRLNADTLSDIAETGLTSGTWGLFTGKYDYTNSDMTLRRNGAVTASTTSFQTNGVTADNDSLYISLGHYSNPTGDATELPLDGLHAEHIIIKGALSDDDIARVEGYIAWSWGVSASLDASHPYKSAPPLAASSASVTASQTAAAATQTVTLAARGAVVATQTAAATTQAATLVGRAAVAATQTAAATTQAATLAGAAVSFVANQTAAAVTQAATLAARGAVQAGDADPYQASVTSLLHMDGANNGTVFTDEKGVVWSVGGDAKTSTAQSRFGGSSALLDGANDWIAASSQAAFGFGTGDWTVECWVRLNANTAQVIWDNRTSGAGSEAMTAFVDATGNLCYFDSSTKTGSGATVTTSAFTHVAWCRASGVIRMFVGGKQVFSGPLTADMGASRPMKIGEDVIGGADINAYIDEWRVTKAARYTADFTPSPVPFNLNYQVAAPTTQVANISASSYLINMLFDTGNGSTSFVDTGSGAQTWSATNGAVCSTAQVLDGVSSLSVPATNAYLASGAATSSSRLPATGDFAIEFMARASNWASACLLSLQDAGATAAGTQFALVTDASGHIQIILSDGTTRGLWFTSAALLATNTDLTIRFARSGGSISLHVNGSQLTNNNYAGSLPAVTSSWRIGAAADGTPAPTGYYFDRFTVLAGSTVPDAKVTAGGDPLAAYVVAGLKFDGANGSITITDTKGHAFSVTGTSALSTAQAKFGGSSLLPGGGGGVTGVADAAWQPGAGDFCYEGFGYCTNTAPLQFLANTRNATGQDWGPAIMVQGGQIRGFCGNTSAAAFADTGFGGAVPTNAWFHWAYTRSGNTFRIFLNGVPVASTTSTGTCGTGTPLRIGYDPSNSGRTFQGYIDDVLITQGAARYTAPFEVRPFSFDVPYQIAEPTTQVATLQVISKLDIMRGVSSLLHMDGPNGSKLFPDQAGKTWTAAGAVTSNGSELVNSALATGSISTPNHADFDVGSGDFTFAMWVEPSELNGYDVFLTKRASGANYAPFTLQQQGTTSGLLQLGMSANGSSWGLLLQPTARSLNPGIRSHLAVTRKGNTITLWMDGTALATGTFTGAVMTNSNAVTLAADGDGADWFRGKIDEFIFIKGYALWDASFTPPTYQYGGAQLAEATTQVATLSSPAAGFVANQTAAATTQAATLAARAAVSAAQTAASTTQTATLAARAAISAAQTAAATSQVATLERPGAFSVTASQTAQATTQVATLVSRMVVQAAQQAEATSQAATLAVRALLTAAQTAAPTTQAATLVRPAQGIVADQVAQPTSQAATLAARAVVQAQQVAQATTQVATLLALAAINANQLAQPTTQAARLTLNFDFERSPRTLDWPDGDRMLVRADDEGSADRVLAQLDFDRTLVWPEQGRTLIAIGD